MIKTILIFIMAAALFMSFSLHTPQALEPVIIEYHHTRYVYKHDDIGLVKLEIDDVREKLR